MEEHRLLQTSQSAQPIYLYGPSGTGKTTIGKLLATHLNRSFVDLDLEIEKKAGKTIPEIFAEEGESGFRVRESAALHETLSAGAAVVSLGGGAFLASENLAFARKAGVIVCLKAEPGVLFERLQKDSFQRPLIQGENARAKLDALLTQRASHYVQFRNTLDTSVLSPEEAAWEIQIMIGLFHVKGMGQGYDVVIRIGGLDLVPDLLDARGLESPFAVVTDENVGSFYAKRISSAFDKLSRRNQVINIPPGEHSKNLEMVQTLWRVFLKLGIERKSTVVSMGGGVVGDLSGFAAATFLRGVPWVEVPTSLLAMVDASLGGKTGIDLAEGKNLVGAFHAPRLVVADPDTLKTLPERELIGGMAEVIKHGVIRDPGLFFLAAKGWGELQNLDALVRRAMAVKIRIIQEDPFERGIRAALNFGHTVGHGIEHISGFQIRHGEAVAIGMVAEAYFAERIGLAAADTADEIKSCLQTIGLPTRIPAEFNPDEISRAMLFDKKKARGKLRFALPPAIGKVEVGILVDEYAQLLSDFMRKAK